jgi:hypothetical protein
MFFRCSHKLFKAKAIFLVRRSQSLRNDNIRASIHNQHLSLERGPP